MVPVEETGNKQCTTDRNLSLVSSEEGTKSLSLMTAFLEQRTGCEGCDIRANTGRLVGWRWPHKLRW